MAFPSTKDYELLDIREAPRVGVIAIVLAKWTTDHTTNENASHSLLQELCVILAWLKAILGNYHCQI